MSDFETVDFFRDGDLVTDPYPYFDYLRSKCPVTTEPNYGVVMVTGYDESLAVYHDTETFSSANSVSGPFPGFPVPMEGDDVSDLIEQYRDQLPFSDNLPTMDLPKHRDYRALLMRLLTPRRLKENEESMWRLADRQIDRFKDRGECEFVRDFAGPFTTAVIADLLGVPEDVDAEVSERPMPYSIDEIPVGDGKTEAEATMVDPLGYLSDQFSAYIEDRRREPRNDVLTGLAQATFPDGSLPAVSDVVKVATNLFAAGQETTVRLLAYLMQQIGEEPELQQRLRQNRELVPSFIEECLRVESPVKGDFRVARRKTTIGGVEIPAGTTVMVLNGAANRDPGRFDCPNELRLDRPNSRDQIAFGHGMHFCPGAPLARTEGRVCVERVLDRLADVRISETHHGPPGNRHYEYVPTYVLRGHTNLHLEFTAVT
jgi:cytochrome P450 family 150 subfamily A5